MEIVYIKLAIIMLAVVILLIARKMIPWMMRDKWIIQKDVQGNNVKIKTQGYMRFN